jgi:hypothetical protein
MPSQYDCISNNPFGHLKASEGVSECASTISHMVSQWVRQASEHSMQMGKKVNPVLNFQVNDKVKLVNRLMHRLMSALGASNVSGGGGVNLMSFLSVGKADNAPLNGQNTREKIIQILYSANEKNRSYYLKENPKALFSRCLRLFFVYQRMDTYETLMLHDYGFYKFEKFTNYV